MVAISITNSWKRNSRAASESDKKDGINVFELKESFEGSNGTVSLTVNTFFTFKIYHELDHISQ